MYIPSTPYTGEKKRGLRGRGVGDCLSIRGWGKRGGMGVGLWVTRGIMMFLVVFVLGVVG